MAAAPRPRVADEERRRLRDVVGHGCSSGFRFGETDAVPGGRGRWLVSDPRVPPVERRPAAGATRSGCVLGVGRRRVVRRRASGARSARAVAGGPAGRGRARDRSARSPRLTANTARRAGLLVPGRDAVDLVDLAVAGGGRCVGPVGGVRSTVPRACRAVSANGWKMLCRQAGPPGSVRIGAITLASWAWQATPTRSACRSRVISRPPTTTASVTS